MNFIILGSMALTGIQSVFRSFGNRKGNRDFDISFFSKIFRTLVIFVVNWALLSMIFSGHTFMLAIGLIVEVFITLYLAKVAFDKNP